MTSDIAWSGADCTPGVTPRQLVQSSSENDTDAKSRKCFSETEVCEKIGVEVLVEEKSCWARPKSLVEVVECSDEKTLAGHIREFLDEFYTEADSGRKAEMLAAEPPLLENPHHNAYLAAVAEHLALRYRLSVPDWVHEKSRFLKRAWFPCGLESLKAQLIKESPASFRRRMIFVDLDPLYRPSRGTPPITYPGPMGGGDDDAAKLLYLQWRAKKAIADIEAGNTVDGEAFFDALEFGKYD